MSFNKYYVPEPADLADQVKKNGPTAFANIRRKVDALVGDSESMCIIEHIYEQVKEGLSDDTILESLAVLFPDLFTGLP